MVGSRLAQLHAIFKRAQRVHGLPANPVAGAERQPHRRSGDFTALAAAEVELLAANAANDQDAALSRSRPLPAFASESYEDCVGPMWIGIGGSST